MNAYKFFLEFHSGFRYVVFVMVVIAIFSAFAGWFGKKTYSDGNRKFNLFTMISVHTQILLGLVLYFLSPFVKFAGGVMKDPASRYWTVEHISMMIIAMILVTIGHSKSKKAILPGDKHKAIAVFYTAAFVIIVVAIALMTKDVPGRTFFGMSY
ncbi:cytochrome B [Mucilaginibacter sp. AK015]|uniref:cytochrome B n=1 Tax=Mucilaginibacter sp. AK015 TaxID=2723072 RepID=UPI0016230485|nr:cytochrome B [Mucilaginibacter sp. AK015]MBB5397884.1 putative membrane protein [Mucilaginibacter sp. AK015]